MDKRAYISLADANRIKEIKETPWIAGKKSSQKAEKPPLSTTPVQVTKIVTEKAEKRASSRKQKNTRLPDGCMLASKFAEEHGVARPTFIDHMTKGLGQGLIGTHTDTIPERDRVHYSERVKPNRPKEKEKYLTSEQQHGALEFPGKGMMWASKCATTLIAGVIPARMENSYGRPQYNPC